MDRTYERMSFALSQPSIKIDDGEPYRPLSVLSDDFTLVRSAESSPSGLVEALLKRGADSEP